jgi:hypothetical protein
MDNTNSSFAGVTMQTDRAVHDPKVHKTWHTVRNKLLGMSKEFHGFLALSDAAMKSIDLAIKELKQRFHLLSNF